MPQPPYEDRLIGYLMGFVVLTVFVALAFIALALVGGGSLF